MSDFALPVPTEQFSLAARIEGPADAPGLLLCHPHPAFGGTMDTPLVAALALGASATMRVLRFNFRGIGGSGGKPEGGLAEHRDVIAAATWLRANTGGPIAVAGYSFGALMAARAIATGEHATRLAAIALPTVIVRDHAERIADVRRAFAAQPTLLIAGTKDQFCDWQELRAWSEGAPAATCEELPGVTHFPTGPALDTLLARVISFLSK